MHNKQTLAAIAYAINYAIENEKNIQSQGDDTPDAHALFIETLKRGQSEIENLLSGDSIASIWSIDDVYTVAEEREYGEVTEQQAKEVLQSVEHNHDANYGINWDTLADTLYTILEEAKK